MDDIDREELDLLRRAYELRVARKIGVILADSGRIYVCDSEWDPWGTKRRLSHDRFRELVEVAEAAAGWTPRKPVLREKTLPLENLLGLPSGY